MDRMVGVFRRLATQDVARRNAAAGMAELRQRRSEQEDVDAYLATRRPRSASDVRRGH